MLFETSTEPVAKLIKVVPMSAEELTASTPAFAPVFTETPDRAMPSSSALELPILASEAETPLRLAIAVASAVFALFTNTPLVAIPVLAVVASKLLLVAATPPVLLWAVVSPPVT